MKQIRRYIERWLGGMLMLLLLMACSKSSSEGGEEPVPEPEPTKPVLKLYVFAPDHPIVTRAEAYEVDASAEENRIQTLHVWVFEHENGKLVGYVNMNNVEISQSGSEVAIEISDDFINRKPAVDVFVAANVSASNCGISLGEKTARSDLEGMLIDSGYFGLTSLVGAIPGGGLPMSGVLKNQPVNGESPVLRVGETGLANVRLVRAVSKVRFVFCKSAANTETGLLTIDEINLGYEQTGETPISIKLPKQEFLFLDGAYPDVKSKINTAGGYEDVRPIKSSINGDTIRKSASPSSYTYTTSMTGQQYEKLINDSIKAGYLSDVGSFYLRESNNGLAGTIKYKIGSTEKTKVFATKDADEFTRNHMWIVYGYFVTSGELELNAVEVINWNNEDSSGEIYNW